MLIIIAAFFVLIPFVPYLGTLIFLVFPVIPIPFLVILVPAAFVFIIPVVALMNTFPLIVVILCKVCQHILRESFHSRRRRGYGGESKWVREHMIMRQLTLRAMSCFP